MCVRVFFQAAKRPNNENMLIPGLRVHSGVVLQGKKKQNKTLPALANILINHNETVITWLSRTILLYMPQMYVVVFLVPLDSSVCSLHMSCFSMQHKKINQRLII